MLGQVDVDAIAAEVTTMLELLAVEELWDRAGSHRGGYVDSTDAAFEMFNEAMAPFLQDIESDREPSLAQQAELRYQGLLMGLHDFETRSTTEFKEWATDLPQEFFRSLLDGWIELPGRQATPSDIRDFLELRCPAYAAWAVRRLRGADA